MIPGLFSRARLLADRERDVRLAEQSSARVAARHQAFGAAVAWLEQLRAAVHDAAVAECAASTSDNFADEQAMAFRPPCLTIQVVGASGVASHFAVEVRHGLISVFLHGGSGRLAFLSPNTVGPNLLATADARLAQAIASDLLAAAG